jgi:hypothetical protein
MGSVWVQRSLRFLSGLVVRRLAPDGARGASRGALDDMDGISWSSADTHSPSQYAVTGGRLQLLLQAALRTSLRAQLRTEAELMCAWRHANAIGNAKLRKSAIVSVKLLDK